MTDDELRARLRAADPARDLPPDDPARVARLVEDVMSTELTDENRATGVRRRSPLTWAVAAAAVLVIAFAGVVGVRALDSDDPPVAGGGPSTSSVTTLGVPDEADTGRCMAPNAQALASAQVAVDGTVTEIANGVVTVTPTHWYAGAPTDTVQLTAPDEHLQLLAGAPELTVGDRYLISASAGQVSLCGFSGPWSQSLATLYEQAFGG